jgi:hypothetical protein
MVPYFCRLTVSGAIPGRPPEVAPPKNATRGELKETIQ